jgi:signal transduction histidine kinase
LSHLEFKVTQDNILLIISFVIYAFLPSFNPESVQRYLMAKNSQQLKNSFKAAFAFSIIISLSIATIAYIVKASGYNGNSQEALLYFIQEFLPIGLQGLMVAGLLAIFMSKAESSVTATSVVIVNDIAKSLFPNMSDASQLLLLRATIIILTFTSISMISSADHLIDIFWFARNFWDPIIFIPITAGFLGFRSNYISFLSSTVCALIATVLGRLYTGEFATISYGFGILGSMFGFFSAHYTQIALGHIIQKAQIQNKITIFTKIANSANHFTNRVKAQLNKKQQNKPKYNEFCILVMISLSIYAVYFVITKSSPVIAVVFLIGYFLALLFLLRDGLFPAHLVKKCFTAYWYFLLTYCLPFTAGCFLFFSQDNIFWLLSGVMAIFALSFFVDSFRFILLNTIGIALAYILYIIVHSTCHFALLGNITYLYLFIFLATLYFLRSREIEQEQKLETMKIFSGAIAHEVKNPLASLNMSAQTITAILENTHYKEHDGKIMLELNKDEFAFLKNVSKALETVSNNSVATVDNLLESIKNHTSTEDKRVYKISEVIKITLDEYTHNKFIELNITDDFSFYGSLKNVKHLLLNLLCNANKHGGDDVHISITTKDHKLFFKDHGKGISAEDTTKIFDSFYTKSKSGTGIGLAFCKMVIEEMGGNIECHSEVGRYTEFVITFG